MCHGKVDVEYCGIVPYFQTCLWKESANKVHTHDNMKCWTYSRGEEQTSTQSDIPCNEHSHSSDPFQPVIMVFLVVPKQDSTHTSIPNKSIGLEDRSENNDDASIHNKGKLWNVWQLRKILNISWFIIISPFQIAIFAGPSTLTQAKKTSMAPSDPAPPLDSSSLGTRACEGHPDAAGDCSDKINAFFVYKSCKHRCCFLHVFWVWSYNCHIPVTFLWISGYMTSKQKPLLLTSGYISIQ